MSRLLTRRHFIQAGLTAAALPLLAACSAPVPAAPTAAPKPPEAPAKPTDGPKPAAWTCGARSDRSPK